MIKYLLIIIITSLLSAGLKSQVHEVLPSIDNNDLPEAKFSSVRTFSGESLYGYIDGGADLYLEYGFTGVIVKEFVYLKGKYKTEVYKMINPEAAYGIFSVSRFRCRTRPAVSTYTCQNKYQLQICTGPYYINIINESGSSADSSASLIIGKKIVDKISEPPADLIQFLPGTAAETVRNESCLVKGRLGIINGAPDLDGYLKGLEGFTAVILKTAGKTLISVKFENREALEKFGALHGWELDKLSESAYKMTGGEEVRKLNDNHLLIEIIPTLLFILDQSNGSADHSVTGSDYMAFI